MSKNICEEILIAAGRGKWSQAGVPRSGWQCVNIEDLGEPIVTCDMCETQIIRYVHHMKHPYYPDMLGVGCVCAGHMEGDLAAAKGRETSMKSRASKRDHWLSRKWLVSQNGNDYIRAYGYRIVVYERDDEWVACVNDDTNSFTKYISNNLTSDEAKLAAFDYIMQLKADNT